MVKLETLKSKILEFSGLRMKDRRARSAGSRRAIGLSTGLPTKVFCLVVHKRAHAVCGIDDDEDEVGISSFKEKKMRLERQTHPNVVFVAPRRNDGVSLLCS